MADLKGCKAAARADLSFADLYKYSKHINILEVVSKFQIRFKGPAKRDYISNLKKIKVCIKRQADRESAAYMGM